MNYWWLLFIPFASAITGWIANKVIIRVILHQQKNKTGFLSTIKSQICSFINEQLSAVDFSYDTLESKLTAQENFVRMMPMVEAHIDIFLREKLKKEMPVIGTMIGEKTIGQLKEIFIKELEELFPEMMKNYFQALKTQVDPRQLIVLAINDIFAKPLNDAFRKHFYKQLKLVELYGALTGFIIGIVQVAFILLFHS